MRAEKYVYAEWSILTKFDLKKVTGHIDDRSLDIYVNPDEADALAASAKMAAVQILQKN